MDDRSRPVDREKKSGRIVVDKIGCLRAVRGNGAALPFERLLIEADPEAAANRTNLCRGWKRMSPDDILEQPDPADPTLNLTRDLIRRPMVAVRIMPPANKKGARANFPHAIHNSSQSRARPLRPHEGQSDLGA